MGKISTDEDEKKILGTIFRRYRIRPSIIPVPGVLLTFNLRTRMTEPRRTEPRRTETRRTEPRRTEARRTETRRTEPRRTETRRKTRRTETRRTEARRTETRRTETRRTPARPSLDQFQDVLDGLCRTHAENFSVPSP
uniref:Uncharacterized protein n=1 Tax=Myotis myotis TaxID=51298 RepID=A0A7J7XIM5_MYOMY|nr:hypothetical protein mMyoMyo1_011762 [Myotis myotis]